MEKRNQYFLLVEKRKACDLCQGLTNPSRFEDGVYDGQHIGPWTGWQGNLDANLMIIAQDWGGTDFFMKNRGLSSDENATNKAIRELLAYISIPIDLPRQVQKAFFLQIPYCLRSGRLSGPVKGSWFKNCSKAFLRPQIDSVSPRVVATLGFKAYRAVLDAYGLFSRSLMRDAVREVIALPNGSSLVPLYHPGKQGTLARSLENQKFDWLRISAALAK